MRARHRAARAASAAVLAAACAVLPAGAVGAGPAPGPTTLTVATTGTVDSLSPFLAQRVLPTSIHRLVYDFLTNYDAADLRPVPAMATAWRSSPDKLTWTYTIRSGMTWSDGRPVTARDIAWTYRLMMTDADAATANGNFVANFRAVEAPDDATLVIRLARPQATMLALDIPVVPAHVWQGRVGRLDSFHDDAGLPIVSSGPFRLTGYQPGRQLELTANRDYWRGAPRFDRVVFRIFKDLDAAVAALRKGEVDFVGGLTPAQFDSLGGVAGIVRNRAQGKAFHSLNLNPGATTTAGEPFGDGHPALRDRRVRHAIRYAIDTAALVDRALGGYAEVGQGYLPAVYAANHWRPDPQRAYRFDPARAERLLDEAGYRRGPDGRRVTPRGDPLTLRLGGMSRRPTDTQNATYVAEWLDAVGITVRTSIVDENVLVDTVVAGEYDLVFDGWVTNPDPDYVLSIQTCATRPDTAGAGFPGANFGCDPAYDRLYARQLAEYDPAARTGLIRQMQQLLYEDAYVNVLYYPNVLEAYRSDAIAGMLKQPQPDGAYGVQDGYWSWWSATPAAGVGGRAGPRGRAVAVAVALAALASTLAVLVVARRRARAADRE